jgi:hypothetical protein
MIKKSLDQGCHGINKLRVAMKLFTSIIFDIYLTTFNLTGYNSNCFKENIFFLRVLLNHATGMEIVVKIVNGFIRFVYV